MRFWMIGCALFSLSALAQRQYVPGQNHELRIVGNVWQVGVLDSSDQWQALPVDPSLAGNPNLEIPFSKRAYLGEGYVGVTASFLHFPWEKVPSNISFSANPQDFLGNHRIDIPIENGGYIGSGYVFVSDQVYDYQEKTFQGIRVTVYSERKSPMREVVFRLAKQFIRLIPHGAERYKEGGLKYVILSNTTEHFAPGPLLPEAPYGHYFESGGAAMVIEDGDTLHNMERVGHLVSGPMRMKDGLSMYGAGQVFMPPYDVVEQMAKSPAELAKFQCGFLTDILSYLQATAVFAGGAPDYSHNLDSYITDPANLNGNRNPMYNNSGYYWYRINQSLSENHQANIYALIDYVAQHGLSAGENDLDILNKTYAAMNPSGAAAFAELTNGYFRERNLGDLIALAQQESKSKCR